jgi:hypothetical protein
LDEFQFRWDLIDQVSRSANAIERSLSRAEAAMKHAQGTARGGSSSWAMMGIKMGTVAGIASEVTRQVFGAGEAVLKLGVSGVKFALEAASFRENSLLALEAILGSRRAAEQAMDAWSRLSEKTPFDNREVQEWGKQLVIAGESLQNSMTILKAASDLGTALGSTSEKRKAIGESFVEWAAGIKQLGSMADMRRLRELSQFGLSPQKAEQNLAARLTGGNIPALQKLMEQAKATGKDLSFEIILAAVQATQDTYGKLGKLGGKGSETLSGLFTKIDFDDLFKGLETSAGFGALKDVLRNIRDLLDPRTAGGKAIHDAMMQLSNTMGEMLKPLTGPEGKKRMEEFFASMLGWIEKIIPTAGRLSHTIDTLARVFEGVKSGAGMGAEPKGSDASVEAVEKAFDTAMPTPGQAMFDYFHRAGKSFPGAVPSPYINPTINVQNTIHVHGNADTDNLLFKIDVSTKEALDAYFDTLGLQAGAH